jgi:PBSX family phage portal protein
MNGDMSDTTREKIGIMPREEASDLDNALGVKRFSKATPIVSEVYKNDPILKAEKEMLNTQHMGVEDDPFTQLGMTGLGEKGQILEPTYNLVTLKALTHQNNTLLQAISAMEVNVDGTGYELNRKDGEVFSDDDKKKAKKISEFFDEPWPGMSFTTIRKAIRRDLEATGNAYLEVIRNKKGDIVFLRQLDAMLMRFMKLEDAVPVSKKIKRGGSEINVKVMERQRKFVQKIGDTKVRFFKEFGVERELNADTGNWADNLTDAADAQLEPLKDIDKANELIHFSAVADVLTPYGVPRWINNLPSVLGSRKAEEFNLEFFDHGGLPPAMILIQGGQLSNEARTTLTNYLSGKAALKQRGIITEIYAASGDLGSAGNVKVSVERFGDERQKDAMFATYDSNCAEHVRISFRLPPMFLGLSEAYNFATAYTAYMIAEAQVFLPERDEFDEVINLTVMKELSEDYIFSSKTLNVVDVEAKLKAMELSKEYQNPSDFVDQLNDITRSSFTAKEGADDLADETDKATVDGLVEAAKPAPEPVITGTQGPQGGSDGRVLKVDFDAALRELAEDWAGHLTGQLDMEKSSVQTMSKLITQLDPSVRKLFDGYVGMKMSSGGLDDDGIAELMACVGHRHD